MHRYRTHTCGVLRADDIGKEVRLSGWCHRIRDHGGVLFIDLRDHYGITQVVADPDSPCFKDAEKLRSEWVVRIDGKVRKRPAGTENPELPTGAVEVYIREIEVLGRAAELPMPVFGEQEYPEDIRLKYRFLDLRREHLHRNIMTRGAVIDSLRRRMKEQGFFEFQTPILTASSPEGARDYLVPSRLHPGKFYALPQAPQQFKQLIMVAGFDRYFQIAPCFRDEDARADRSPGPGYIRFRAGGSETPDAGAPKPAANTAAANAAAANAAAKGIGPIANNLGDERVEALRAALALTDGDAVFFVAGDPAKFVKF